MLRLPLGMPDLRQHADAVAHSGAVRAAATRVTACMGDVPTLETLAGVSILCDPLPALRFRMVNVVDLIALQPKQVHPHGLLDAAFDALCTPVHQ